MSFLPSLVKLCSVLGRPRRSFTLLSFAPDPSPSPDTRPRSQLNIRDASFVRGEGYDPFAAIGPAQTKRGQACPSAQRDRASGCGAADPTDLRALSWIGQLRSAVLCGHWRGGVCKTLRRDAPDDHQARGNDRGGWNCARGGARRGVVRHATHEPDQAAKGKEEAHEDDRRLLHDDTNPKPDSRGR